MPSPRPTAVNSNAEQDTKAHPAKEGVNRRCSTNPNINQVASSSRMNRTTAQAQSPIADLDVVTGAIEGLSSLKNKTNVLFGPESAESNGSVEDDQSHLSSSSLKQQGFDTKSMASVTTFAMDEKESIRPDDSASVRASEDDDASVLSRISTFPANEVSASVARGPSRPTQTSVTISARRYPTLSMSNPPRFGDLPVSPIAEVDDMSVPPLPARPVMVQAQHDGHHPTLAVIPDEKLLDALATPKDRLPLLQLEEKLLEFIAMTR